MKKITLLISAVLIFTLSFYSCEESQLDTTGPEAEDPGFTELVAERSLDYIFNPGDIKYCFQQEVCLWAGQHIDAGSVTIGNDDENLFITVYSEQGFQEYKTEDGEFVLDDYGNKIPATEQIKIDVATSLPGSKPVPGHLPYKYTTSSGETSVTLKLSFEELSVYLETDVDCSYVEDLFVFVHADVLVDEDGDGSKEGETAWGGCEDGAGNAWWYYIDYTPHCCECWCGFGNDYLRSDNPDADACKSGMFDGNSYMFWSNEFYFGDMVGDDNVGIDYTLSLLVDSNSCVPQETNGDMKDLGDGIHNASFEVGNVVLHAFVSDGKDGYEKGMRYVNVIYTLNDMYKGYNIQLDLYNGADRVPNYSIQEMLIIEDDLHRLYQTELTPGEVTHTFTIPWLTNEGENMPTYIALHAAIGDCPMPSLQEPYRP